MSKHNDGCEDFSEQDYTTRSGNQNTKIYTIPPVYNPNTFIPTSVNSNYSTECTHQSSKLQFEQFQFHTTNYLISKKLDDNLPSKHEFDTIPLESKVEKDDTVHHVFSDSQKKFLIHIVALAALFGPLSSNIYFPAMDTIANELHTSIEMIAVSLNRLTRSIIC